jgi:hypothetical protein
MNATFATPVLIGLAHWNPHWQCFVQMPSCAAAATSALTTLLNEPQPSLDFVNVVEFENATYQPPAGWASIAPDQDCGHDWDTLFYRTDRWVLKEASSGCLVPSRSYAAGTFQSKSHPALIVAVMGAHFPQTLDASTHAYENATRNATRVFRKLGNHERALFLGDTNTEGPEAAAANQSHHGVNKTNGELMADMALWGRNGTRGEPPGAPLFKGCCYSDGFSWEGDRIIANFGSVVSSQVLFDPAPAWAAFSGSEFHKGVRLVLDASTP